MRWGVLPGGQVSKYPSFLPSFVCLFVCLFHEWVLDDCVDGDTCCWDMRSDVRVLDVGFLMVMGVKGGGRLFGSGVVDREKGGLNVVFTRFLGRLEMQSRDSRGGGGGAVRPNEG